MKNVKNFSIILAGLVLGILVFVFMGSNRAAVNKAAPEDKAAAAFYVDLSAQTFKPFIVAYGDVEPRDEITVSSEVSARVVYVHPDLKEGQILKEGTEVMRLDQTSIKLDLIQAQANLKSKQVSREQTLLQQKNLKDTLAVARERLKLQKQEYNRLANLAKSGNVSSSDLDTQKRSTLSVQAEVDSTELDLELIPSTLAMTDEEIKNLESIVEQKKIDLANTVITMQKSWRITDVSVSEGSYVSTGTALFTTSSPNDYEVEARVSSNQFVNVLGPNTDFTKTSATVSPLTKQAIKLAGQPLRASEGLDSATRMMGIVVAFRVPVELSVRGLYTEVKIFGPEQSLWVVPRSAIHQGQLYLIGDDNTLKTEPVDVRFYQEDYAVLQQAPSSQRVIVSNLSPAVIGMKIDGTLQKSAMTQMAQTLTSH